MLTVLVADDELPALEELAYLLRQDPRVGAVRAVSSGAAALTGLEDGGVDAVFLDIRMPGFTGLDVARVLARFAEPPAIVFVTAHEDHAVDAFDLTAVDYLLKPVRPERLAEAVRRVVARVEAPSAPAVPAPPADEQIAVELAGVTRFVNRSDVRWVEAHGDYARLHTADGAHLVRISLATLEERWGPVGFVRIHRSHLVCVRHIDDVRFDTGRATVRLGDQTLAVSRRHTRDLRERIVGPSRLTGGPARPGP